MRQDEIAHLRRRAARLAWAEARAYQSAWFRRDLATRRGLHDVRFDARWPHHSGHPCAIYRPNEWEPLPVMGQGRN